VIAVVAIHLPLAGLTVDGTHSGLGEDFEAEVAALQGTSRGGS